MIISAVQQSDSVIHVHIHSLSDSFPTQIITEYWVEFPVLYSRSPLASHSIYHSVPMPVPNHGPPQPPTFCTLFFVFFVCLFVLFFVFMALPAAYGNSQARGWIVATTAGLHHSLQQHRILNPLSEARDGTHVLIDISWVCYCWATKGIPNLYPLITIYPSMAQWVKNPTAAAQVTAEARVLSWPGAKG